MLEHDIPFLTHSLSLVGQGWLQSLEMENDRLRGELDALRQRAVSTPQRELRDTNDRLTAQLREVQKADKTRAQLGFEIADLKQQLDQLKRSQGKEGPANLRRQLKVRDPAHSCWLVSLTDMAVFTRTCDMWMSKVGLRRGCCCQL